MNTQRRQLVLSSIGFGLILSLNAFTLWGISSLLSGEMAWPWAASELESFCLPANVLTFLLYGLLAVRFKGLSRHRPVITACVLLIVGGILLLAACLIGDPDLPLFQLAGICLGIGGAVAFIFWELTFSLGSIDQARISILLASLFSIIPYLLLTLLAGDMIVFPLVGILIPCCVILLILSRVFTPEPGMAVRETDPDTGRPDWRGLWSHAWIPLACTMMIGVIGPAIGEFASLGTMSDMLRSLLYQFANIAAVIVLALCWFRFRARPSIEVVFLVLVPVAAVVLFLLPFWSQGYPSFVRMFGCFIFSLVSILMMMRCIELSRIYHVGLSVVYGFFAAGTYLAQILGGSLANIVSTSTFTRQFQTIAIVVLLVWGLSALGIATMWHLRPRIKPNAPVHTSSGADEQSSPQTSADTLKIRCTVLSERFNLTPREAEILELIGHGRDVGAIAAILGLSRNTVRTHIQRLYAATDVHTRQELIDLIENATPDE